MCNPTFSFEIGQPVGDRGRWVEGSVIGDDDGYTLQANLCFSRDIKSCDLQMHRLAVRIDRAFEPGEFGLLLQPLRSGRFATVTNAFQLVTDENSNPPIEGMEAALSVDPEQLIEPPSALEPALSAIRTELDTVTRREILGRAFMMVGSRPGSHIVIGDPCDTRPNTPG